MGDSDVNSKTFKQHGRQYDLVVFGATGYTGKYTAELVATQLPTNVKWAVAGRSREKLETVVAKCEVLNPKRPPPAIEICSLNSNDLETLAKKTFIVLTTVGPYFRYGEPVFKACAENGTYYVDVTGEVPWVARMIVKYEATARASGAIMIPQNGVESAISDLVAWSIVGALRDKFAAKARDVVISVHTLNATPSGGTLDTVLSIMNHCSLKEMRDVYKPFALSPKKPTPMNKSTIASSRFARTIKLLTGLVNIPVLGLNTTSLAGSTDAAIVCRSWGLLASKPPGSSDLPQEHADTYYGDRFTFAQHRKTGNWVFGTAFHYAFVFAGILIAVPPLRWLVRKFVYQPGQGVDEEGAGKEELEYRGVGWPDFGPSGPRGNSDDKKMAYSRAVWKGSMYKLTGALLVNAAMTLLEDDHDIKGGGVYTPACLGRGYVQRLDRAGFTMQTKALETL